MIISQQSGHTQSRPWKAAKFACQSHPRWVHNRTSINPNWLRGDPAKKPNPKPCRLKDHRMIITLFMDSFQTINLSTRLFSVWGCTGTATTRHFYPPPPQKKPSWVPQQVQHLLERYHTSDPRYSSHTPGITMMPCGWFCWEVSGE